MENPTARQGHGGLSLPTGRAREAALRRINRIAGQLQGLRRMVEDGRYCIDVLTQIKAAEAALHSLARLVLQNHLETCVTDAFESADAGDRREKIAELVRVFDGMRPK